MMELFLKLSSLNEGTFTKRSCKTNYINREVLIAKLKSNYKSRSLYFIVAKILCLRSSLIPVLI